MRARIEATVAGAPPKNRMFRIDPSENPQ
jgi:hypothetical protein